MTQAAARTEVVTRDEFVDSLIDATLMATMVVGMTLLLMPVFVRAFEQSSTVAQSQMSLMQAQMDALERERFQGYAVELTLDCKPQRQAVQLLTRRPYTAWATAVFYNEGPDEAYIAVNQQDTYFTIKKNEVHPMDFTRAYRRIDTIYYWCNPGRTASVRALGKY